MITSLMEMHELPNLAFTTIFTVCFKSRDKILLVTPWTKIMTSQPLFQNTYILRRLEVGNFVDFIKITKTLIKTTYKDVIIAERIRRNVSVQQKLLIYGEKC